MDVCVCILDMIYLASLTHTHTHTHTHTKRLSEVECVLAYTSLILRLIVSDCAAKSWEV